MGVSAKLHNTGLMMLGAVDGGKTGRETTSEPSRRWRSSGNGQRIGGDNGRRKWKMRSIVRTSKKRLGRSSGLQRKSPLKDVKVQDFHNRVGMCLCQCATEIGCAGGHCREDPS